MDPTASQEKNYPHIPVMVSEVMELLLTDPNGLYLDGTVGLGGHATHILNALSDSGRLIGVDRDEKALAICKKRLENSRAFSCHHTSYQRFPDILRIEGVSAVNGFLLDLGLSSMQLCTEKRGFSYQTNGPLDMRFNSSKGLTASDLILASDEQSLANILFTFGEERNSRRIARSIKKMGVMQTVEDLKEAIRRSTPPKNRHKTFARVFQALRISVNGELDRLHQFLKLFMNHLLPNGRIVIISYHSLEDRIVKHAFKQFAKDNIMSILTKKPLPPQKEEIKINPRSRSAKLRAGKKSNG